MGQVTQENSGGAVAVAATSASTLQSPCWGNPLTRSTLAVRYTMNAALRTELSVQAVTLRLLVVWSAPTANPPLTGPTPKQPTAVSLAS